MAESHDSSVSTVNTNGLILAVMKLTTESFRSIDSKNRQSPINIEKRKAIKKNYPPITMSGYAKAADRMTLSNTGHTAEIRPAVDGAGAYISGGPLMDKYKFLQLHFHWGTVNSIGSEHTIDGQFYSMEAHIVHHNLKYKNIEDCMTKPDGLAIVAIFFQLKSKNEKEDHSVISSITNYLSTARTVGASVDILPDVLAWVDEHCLSCSEYYTYQGSLTTPPFTENVTWLVYSDSIKVSSRQINVFRELNESGKSNINSNRRQTQSLGQCQVYLVKNTSK